MAFSLCFSPRKNFGGIADGIEAGGWGSRLTWGRLYRVALAPPYTPMRTLSANPSRNSVNFILRQPIFLMTHPKARRAFRAVGCWKTSGPVRLRQQHVLPREKTGDYRHET